MKELFAHYIDVGFSGAIIICLILLFRLLLRKAPKWTVCILWMLVFVQLLIPIRLEAPTSLQPASIVFIAENGDIEIAGQNVDTVIEQSAVRPDTLPSMIPTVPIDSSGNLVWIDYLSIVSYAWIIFTVMMLLYAAASYVYLKVQVREAVILEKGIYIGHNLVSPFLLGYFRPRVYLPAKLDTKTMQYVIAHERAHIRRGDNWIKLLGFVCLAIHWYNPFVWLAYVLLCRDLEMACDEKVVQHMDLEDRKDYSTALLSCSAKGSLVACPVAFGEVSVKQRIISVLNYRKAAFWVCAVAVMAVVLIGVCFLTEPVEEQLYPPGFDKLSSLIGMDPEYVFDALGVDNIETLDVERETTYQLPETVEFGGISFRVILSFDYEMRYLYSIGYYAEDIEIEENVMEEVKSLARKFRKGMGTSERERSNQQPFEQMSNADLIKKISRGNSQGDSWDLTKNAPGSVQRLFKKLHERGMDRTVYYFNYGIGVYDNKDHMTVSLVYHVIAH